MVIIQRWEPSISPTFPSQIPFWIHVQGIPLHLWSDIALAGIARDIGILDKVEITSTTAKIKVEINGLQPLIKTSTLEYDNGDEVVATLVYEKLEKHCGACFSLCHETDLCPENRRNQENNAQAPHRNQLEKGGNTRNLQIQRDSRQHSASNRSTQYHPTTQRYPLTNRELPRRSPSDRYPPSREGKYHRDDQRRVGSHLYKFPPPPERTVVSRYTNSYHHREANSQHSADHTHSYHSREYRRHPVTSDVPHSANSGFKSQARSIWVEKAPQQREPLPHNAEPLERSSSSKSGAELHEQNTHPVSELPTEAMDVALGELRDVMIQYTSCPDPTESAARKERMRQAEEQGDFEETAARMVRASLDNQILVPQSPNNPQISSHERISALQRLGSSLNQEMQIESPPQEFTVPLKRRPGRPPGKIPGASALSRLGTGIRRRTITKVAPSPRKRIVKTIPRKEENRRGPGPSSAGPSNIPRAPKPRAARGRTARTPAAPAKTKRTDFRDPSSPLP